MNYKNHPPPDWNDLILSLPKKKKSLFKCFGPGTLESREDEEGVYTCECKDKWYGPNCNQQRPEFSSTFRYPWRLTDGRLRAIYNTPLSDDYTNCKEEAGILEKLKLSLKKAEKCTYIAGPVNPQGLLLGRFNIRWKDGGVMPINYLGMGENHTHDLRNMKKLGGSGGTILPSVFIQAAMASSRDHNKCVDLFLEHTRFTPSGGRIIRCLEMPYFNMLNVLKCEVAPCLYGIRMPDNSKLKTIVESRMCRFGCKNVRIHETDVRSKHPYHILLSHEEVFGLSLLDLGWLNSRLEWEAEEDIFKFVLYEDTQVKLNDRDYKISNEKIYEVVLYRALAKQMAMTAFKKKVLATNKPSIGIYEWLRKPMLHEDYWKDFRKTNVADPETDISRTKIFTDRNRIKDFLDKKETRSYTNWDKISQVAHRITTDIIYHRNATKKLIRKREHALGEQRCAQLKEAVIKVHNFRCKGLKRVRLAFLAISVMSMDYYTLLRMLSPYDIKKRKGPCPEIFNQPRYIMMVAGSNHILNCASVFRELAGLPLHHVVQSDKTTNLTIPFRITNTMIFDKNKISKAGDSIKTGLDLINEWMEAEIPSPSQGSSPRTKKGSSPRTKKGSSPRTKKRSASYYEGKIFNPKTLRWVKRDGKIGKQILANRSPSPPQFRPPPIVENIRSPKRRRRY